METRANTVRQIAKAVSGFKLPENTDSFETGKCVSTRLAEKENFGYNQSFAPHLGNRLE